MGEADENKVEGDRSEGFVESIILKATILLITSPQSYLKEFQLSTSIMKKDEEKKIQERR